MAIFEGAGVALVTPFHDDFTVNYEKLEELIEMQIRGGTDGIVVLGTTGESSTMSHEAMLSTTLSVPPTNDHVPVATWLMSFIHCSLLSRTHP